MEIKGSIISLNPRDDDGAGVVLDKKAGRTYAFFFHDVIGYSESDQRHCGLKTGQHVAGTATSKGTLVQVHLLKGSRQQEQRQLSRSRQR